MMWRLNPFGTTLLRSCLILVALGSSHWYKSPFSTSNFPSVHCLKYDLLPSDRAAYFTLCSFVICCIMYAVSGSDANSSLHVSSVGIGIVVHRFKTRAVKEEHDIGDGAIVSPSKYFSIDSLCSASTRFHTSSFHSWVSSVDSFSVSLSMPSISDM